MNVVLPRTVLPRARWKVIGFMGLFLLLGGSGGLMLQDGQPFGWAIIAFFGAGALVFLALLVGPYGVTLDAQRFVVRTLTTEKTYFWNQVGTRFAIYRIHGSSMIIFDDGEDEGLMAKANRAVIGPSAAIPAILIGGSLQAACDTLNHYRDNALGVRP